ncbi:MULTISPECIES: tRNA cyclic N6-threonylcarbamoyladenosine(37) synthase TcdA [Campylobacter]|uniref:Dinucleotide-utilizing enzyme, molybdopterin/thiamine biosynthesis family 1 n=1 Tax=Campylobacter curvus (strain 525.92) TaxID=360105 RepID=A7H0A2_CAMC5|nr:MULTISPECIES: tRNA cyclic N6-threonylcarbamoyladenosine(37) synthase TcdA [Campylobacter]EAT99431.2 dinucleotide-utilizing enzyme, molybdopterin/thiamine biosynthesis family 1 [Campylobacter curvus 525.92]EJP74744.1 ThiF family protein [Campylobacter sp. FOBRC14]
MNETIDRYTRVRWLFGDENFDRLKRAKVLVCGVGGVGGMCLDALARSGVGEITAIDKDVFDITNQNRQIYSEAVGAVKVGEFAKRYECVRAVKELMTPEFIAKFSFDEFDVIIDAIDDMSAKIALANAVDTSKFIASMGGAKRIDPAKIKVASVWKTSVDPLARKYRYELKRSGFKGDFEVVFSTEMPLCKPLGSFMGVTACFGLNLASLAVRKILNLA